MTKYIFVTGGVISGLGKGVTSASIGAILQMLGQKNITIKKLDPYLNIDPGTMNPFEHGEVYVTSDGIETDLDLGYYERFLNIETNETNSTSSGKLYQKLLNNERNGDFLGKTVQMVPHFTNTVKEFICSNSNKYEYIICEIGGSVGDMEGMAFYEAIRQLRNDLGYENVLFIHLTYLVHYGITNEIKTKPTQNSIRDLQQLGIIPEILICRTEHLISDEIKEKLSLHTNVNKQNIIVARDVSSIYNVPIEFINDKIDEILMKKFAIKNPINKTKWIELNNKIISLRDSVTIGILGKYTKLNDSYKSLLESIFHAGLYHNYSVKIVWIDAREEFNHSFENLSGVIIPGGFGMTGIETIINYICILRVKKIPLFGICLGMQLMIIEYCRNILGFKNSNSEEFSKGENQVIKKIKNGCMRLGNQDIILHDSKIRNIYGKDIITERHRHRYIINNETNFNNDFIISGRSVHENNSIIETIELKDHPWYIGCQYHPEYKSSPFNPHPLFSSFIGECISTS